MHVNSHSNNAVPKCVGRSERKHVPGIVLPFLVRELLFDLTSAEWKIWTILFSHTNRELICCLKNATVISEASIGVNSFHAAKRGLLHKRWAKNCGQKSGRGPNVYKVLIPIPKPVEEFTSALWGKLNEESWWDKNVGSDGFDYSDDHFDWLVSWRIIRALRDADSELRSADKKAKAWRPDHRISPELKMKAEANLLASLRRAGALLNPERGNWWLFGDGYDEARDTDSR